MSDMLARLVERGRNPRNGGTYEIWDIGDGDGIYVDFNPCPSDTGCQRRWPSRMTCAARKL